MLWIFYLLIKNMKRTKKLFLSSQSFGFGPSAELINISKKLSSLADFENYQYTFYNTPEIQAILKITKSNFQLTSSDNGEGIMGYLRENKSSIDGIISSYDAASIFYGWFHNIPSFFYDGMLSFWDIEKFEEEIPQTLATFQKLKNDRDEEGIVQLYEEITKENHHKSIFLAYFLATKNFARGGDNPEKKLVKFPSLQQKTKIVGGIMNPEIPSGENFERDHILVSLSGSIVPTVTFEQSIQLTKNTIDFVKEASKAATNLPWIVAINPKSFSHLKADGYLSDLPNHIQVRESFSSDENLKSIRTAKAVLISPGFSTIHEAAYYKTPVIFLPEQNGGQPVGYTKLKKEGYSAIPNLTVAENIGGNSTIDFNEFGMSQLYDLSNQLYNSDTFSTLRSSIRELIYQIINNQKVAEKIGDDQYNSIKKIIGGFQGAEEISEGIQNSLNL